MTPEPVDVAVEKVVAEPPSNQLTPAEFLASLPGSPTAEQIEAWKQQAPNNHIELVTPDGKRAFILRGITGLELSQIQSNLEKMATPTTNPELEVQIASVVKACLWTNVGPSGRLTDVLLRTGTAGLPQTLFVVVSRLSDFFDPQQIELHSAEL
jgi:hypothetical protein